MYESLTLDQGSHALRSNEEAQKVEAEPRASNQKLSKSRKDGERLEISWRSRGCSQMKLLALQAASTASAVQCCKEWANQESEQNIVHTDPSDQTLLHNGVWHFVSV